jgi:hypothetical protein
MIQTLPLLPTLATAAPVSLGDRGQSDFGQWLAPGSTPVPPDSPPALPGPHIEDVGIPLAPVAIDPLGAPGAGSDSDPLPLLAPPDELAFVSPVSGAPPASQAADAPMLAPEPRALPPADAIGLVGTLASRSGGDAVDLIFAPWQLMAGHRLSQQWRHSAPTDVLPANAKSERVSDPGIGFPPAVALAEGLPRGAQVWGPAATTLATWWPSTAQLLAAAGATTESFGSGTPSLGAAATWPLRLLRWFSEGPEGATAWLRDFTIDAAAVPTLVNDLRRLAAAQDIPLHRIVLNGQTLWMSSQPTSAQSNQGESHAS